MRVSILRKLAAWRRQHRHRKLVKEHGCVLLCRNCEAVLDGYGTPSWLSVYRYVCKQCRAVSYFDFETYPVPTRVKSHASPITVQSWGHGEGGASNIRSAVYRDTSNMTTRSEINPGLWIPSTEERARIAARREKARKS